MPIPAEHNEQFRRKYPTIWTAFARLPEECHNSGPLDEKTRGLLKVALAVGAGLEGATHSAIRHAREGDTLNRILKYERSQEMRRRDLVTSKISEAPLTSEEIWNNIRYLDPDIKTKDPNVEHRGNDRLAIVGVLFVCVLICVIVLSLYFRML